MWCGRVCASACKVASGKCWVSCSVRTFLVPLRQGLSLNLEMGWRPTCPSDTLPPSKTPRGGITGAHTVMLVLTNIFYSFICLFVWIGDDICARGHSQDFTLSRVQTGVIMLGKCLYWLDPLSDPDFCKSKILIAGAGELPHCEH